MAKPHWIIIFITFLVSCISLALLIVSMSTPYWIVSKASHPSATRDSEIHYGLFSGALKKYVLSSGSEYELSIVCDSENKVCLYSCQQNSQSRQDELQRILKDEPVAPCPTARHLNVMASIKSMSDNILNDTFELSIIQRKSDEFVKLYIHSGYWDSTVAFLSISVIFTTLAAIMSIINVIYNPIEMICSIIGLYIWNGIAMASTTLVLILWGALFEITLQHNIAITDTLQFSNPYNSDGAASLGYSYWLIFVSILLSIGNILLLLFRKYLIEKYTPPPTITVERNDYTIMLY